ncbi:MULTISPECIES: DUF4232 domain-containing protein [unclassified Streptomyces]|uniref:DUF4232 domain-containing protein n=1 Tax=unclassified Streptomyces TaxID=2593676 RepID=UPI002DDB2365|nr:MULTISPECIES: DUF4232 domain-containing protein [unclassified Streptomyces]WSB78143.1 DUF4232 domain-containing protein [Streptomyces sp. NBC_01775]WSS13605.1 DUF4232 domain-containing protein [Streptomyces sp. NBC_01186]WSS42400.1 DUF4232 domain-containing protein [Streptomyces sp. NBC_01187]
MNAKLNRAVRCTAAVLAVIAVGAGATACNSSSGESSSKAGAHSAAKDSASGKQDAAGTKVKKTAAKGSRTDSINSTSASATTSERCHTGELDYSWGGPNGGRPDMEADYQQIASIRLTNSGDRTCTLRGFPGVRLISKSGVAWDLRRSSDTPSAITLKPGDDTAAVSMNVLPLPKTMKGPKPFKVSKVMITPPNETTHVTLKWPYGGALLDQSGATRPGTFVNPVGVG